MIPTTEHKEFDYTVIHEFDPINEWAGETATSKLIARVLEKRGKCYLDIRERQVGTTNEGVSYESFTKRGLRFSIHELNTILHAIFPRALELMRANTKAMTPTK